MFHVIWTLLIGLAAGWIASRVMQAGNAGWLSMMVVGVAGSFVGPALLWLIGLKSFGVAGTLISATLGAVLCIAALRYFGPKF